MCSVICNTILYNLFIVLGIYGYEQAYDYYLQLYQQKPIYLIAFEKKVQTSYLLKYVQYYYCNTNENIKKLNNVRLKFKQVFTSTTGIIVYTD